MQDIYRCVRKVYHAEIYKNSMLQEFFQLRRKLHIRKCIIFGISVVGDND